MYDNNSKQYTPLECKEYIKYLGIIIDCHLSWKHHIDYIALKISKNVGIISKLRHFIPNHTLLDIYRSLILPYLLCGLAAWGNAAKVHIKKLLILQKCVLRLMYFKSFDNHAIPLFVSSNSLPINMMYIKESANMLYDISTGDSPIALQELFKKTSAVHNYNTRAAKKDNFYIKYSRLELQKCSFSRLGAEIWNSIDQSLCSKSKKIFKHKMCQALFTILTTENHYVDVPMIRARLPIVTMMV